MSHFVEQEEVSSTSTVLRNLDSNTVYNVAVVPVYPDAEGIRQEEKGKTSESVIPHIQPRCEGSAGAWPKYQTKVIARFV